MKSLNVTADNYELIDYQGSFDLNGRVSYTVLENLDIQGGGLTLRFFRQNAGQGGFSVQDVFVDNSFLGVQNSTVTANDLFVGNGGTLSLFDGEGNTSGPGNSLTASRVIIGNAGSGTASVGAGTFGSSSGQILLRSTSDTTIGRLAGSDGELNLSAAGRVITDGNAYIGRQSGARGAVSIEGFTSQQPSWDVAGTLAVGGGGAGTSGVGRLNMRGSGRVTAGAMEVRNAGSNVVVADDSQLRSGGMTIFNSADVFSSSGEVDALGSAVAGQLSTARAAVASGGQWRVEGALRVGNASTGMLSVSDRGLVTAGSLFLGSSPTTGSGTVRVGGGQPGSRLDVAGSAWVGFPQGGSGVLEVLSGGAVTAADSLSLWSGSDQIITGSTSNVAGGSIDVGFLNLRGQATSFSGFLDDGAMPLGATNIIKADSATISGDGARWDMRQFFVGFSGSSQATVSEGAAISTVDMRLGNSQGSSGTLRVDGGRVTVAENAILGAGPGATGTIVVNGDGILDVEGDIFVGGLEQGPGGAGSIESSGTVIADNLTVWNAGSSITASPGGGFDIANELRINAGGAATSRQGVLGGPENFAPNDLIGARSANVSGSWAVETMSIGRETDGELTVADGGLVNISGDGNEGSTSLSVGTFGGTSGTLTVAAGGTLKSSQNASVGFLTGSVGHVTIEGADAMLDVEQTLFIGGNASRVGGAADVKVNEGGTLQAGQIRVMNAQSHLSTLGGGVVVADGGGSDQGSLVITNGGRVSSKRAAVDSNLTVFGPGEISIASADVGGGAGASTWDAGELTVGRKGAGRLVVSSGGAVTASLLKIGEFTGGDGMVEVQGNGATLNVQGSSFIGGDSLGAQGQGALVVSQGAALSGGSATVWAGGRLSIENSNVNLRSVRNEGNLSVDGGTLTAGSLVNRSSASVSANGVIEADIVNESEGRLQTFSNATIDGDLTNNAGGSVELYDFTEEGRTVTFAGNVTHNGSFFNVDPTVSAVFNGDVSGEGFGLNINGATRFEAGVDLGSDTRELYFYNDVTFGDAARLQLDIGGTNPDSPWLGYEYDIFNIDGSARLDGTLQFDWYGGFQAGLGDTFDVIRADNIVGLFDDLVPATLGAGLLWDASIVEIVDSMGGSTDVFRLSVLEDVSEVPLPPAAWLFGSALLGLGALKRRKAVCAVTHG